MRTALYGLTLLLLKASAIGAGLPPFTDANWLNAFGPGQGIFGSSVTGVACDTNGNVYVCGGLAIAGNVASTNLAKWDGTAWSNTESPPFHSGGISSLAFDHFGNLYAGCQFEPGGIPTVAELMGTNWSVPGSAPEGVVYALAIDLAGNLYVGGQFTNAGTLGTARIAKWDGTHWSALGAGIGGSGVVFALAVDQSGNLYVGGEFTTAGGAHANNIAKWDGNAWTTLGSGVTGQLATGFPVEVSALAFDRAGNLYAGGLFTNAGGVSASCIAKWNGTAWSALGSGVNNQVLALACDSDGNLFAGGAFLRAGGIGATNIARWNGVSWSPLGSGAHMDRVWGLAFDPVGNLYAVGDFQRMGTNRSEMIAKALLNGPTQNQLIGNTEGPGTNVLSFLGVSGNAYALDLATNLAPPVSWIPQATNVAPAHSGDVTGYVNFTNVSQSFQSFYRTRSVP